MLASKSTESRRQAKTSATRSQINLARWLTRLGAEKLRLLRHLDLDSILIAESYGFARLTAAIDLRKLKVDCRLYMEEPKCCPSGFALLDEMPLRYAVAEAVEKWLRTRINGAQDRLTLPALVELLEAVEAAADLRSEVAAGSYVRLFKYDNSCWLYALENERRLFKCFEGHSS